MKKTLGIDIGGTRVKLGIVQDGTVSQKWVIDADKSNSLKVQLEVLLPTIKKIFDENKLASDLDFGGIGICVPSVVDPKTFAIKPIANKYMDAASVDVVSWVKTNFGCKAVVENDATAAIQGEVAYGVGKGATDAVMMIFGTGIGVAALMDGKLVRGKHNKAGQLCSHMTLSPHNGHQCNCGNRGCLEAFGGGWAMDNPTRRRMRQDKNSLLLNYDKIDFKAIAECVAKKDTYARILRDVTVEYWATLLTNLIRAYDPELVIVSGGPMNSPDIWYEPFKNSINDDVFIDPGDIKFALASDPEASVLLGLHHLL